MIGRGPRYEGETRKGLGRRPSALRTGAAASRMRRNRSGPVAVQRAATPRATIAGPPGGCHNTASSAQASKRAAGRTSGAAAETAAKPPAVISPPGLPRRDDTRRRKAAALPAREPAPASFRRILLPEGSERWILQVTILAMTRKSAPIHGTTLCTWKRAKGARRPPRGSDSSRITTRPPGRVTRAISAKRSGTVDDVANSEGNADAVEAAASKGNASASPTISSMRSSGCRPPRPCRAPPRACSRTGSRPTTCSRRGAGDLNRQVAGAGCQSRAPAAFAGRPSSSRLGDARIDRSQRQEPIHQVVALGDGVEHLARAAARLGAAHAARRSSSGQDCDVGQ